MTEQHSNAADQLNVGGPRDWSEADTGVADWERERDQRAARRARREAEDKLADRLGGWMALGFGITAVAIYMVIHALTAGLPPRTGADLDVTLLLVLGLGAGTLAYTTNHAIARRRVARRKTQ